MPETATTAVQSDTETSPSEAPGHGTRRKFARDSSISVGGAWVSFAVGAAGGLILSRSLQPEGKGNYTALFTLALVAGAFSTLGIDVWASRQIAEHGLSSMVRRVLTRHALWLSVAGVAATSLAFAVAQLQDRLGFKLMALVTVNVWTFGLYALVMSVYRGQRRIVAMFVMQLLSASGFLIAVAVLALQGSLSVATALTIPCVTRMVAVCTPLSAGIARGGAASHHEWWSIIRTHLNIALGRVAEFASYRMDILVVGSLLGATQLGVYSVALPLSELMWLVPNAVSEVLFPHVASSRSTTVTAAAARFTLLLSGASVLGLVIVGPWLILTAYGESFAGAGSVLPMLGIAAMMLSVWKLVSTDLLARGNTSVKTQGAMSAIAVLAIMLVPLTLRFGITGAAAATALGYAAAMGHGVYVWSRLSGANASMLIPFRRGDLAILRSALGRRTSR